MNDHVNSVSGQFTMELPEIRQSHEKLQTINELKGKHRSSVQSHPQKAQQSSRGPNQTPDWQAKTLQKVPSQKKNQTLIKEMESQSMSNLPICIKNAKLSSFKV